MWDVKEIEMVKAVDFVLEVQRNGGIGFRAIP
jgi:hypothetical protein